MHDVGVYIASLRTQQKLSQEEAAQLIKVNRRTVERWEAGKNEPALTTLRDYVERLGGSIDYAIDLLLGRKQQPPSESPGVVVARQRMASLPPDVIEALAPAAEALMRGRQ